jgi:hypothetical protein
LNTGPSWWKKRAMFLRRARLPGTELPRERGVQDEMTPRRA